MKQKYTIHRIKDGPNKGKFSAKHEDGRELFGDLEAIRAAFDKPLGDSGVPQSELDFICRPRQAYIATWEYGTTPSSTWRTQ
jgi:hypothetical protein